MTETPGSAPGTPEDPAAATESAGTESPGTEAPGTESPGTEAPGTESPGTEAPGTEAPGTESPAAESATAESVAASTGAESPDTVVESPWGRVDANGDVFVRTSQGERHIGSWQVGQPEQALAFFGRKYDDLVVQVDLLEQRLESGAAAPEETQNAATKLRDALAEPHAIGDLDALSKRLDAVENRISERRAERKAERARALDEARVRKEQVAQEAESISEGDDWRHGADRLRTLLDEWKSLPRLDRATDDALWRKFSTARTHYTRRRKAHFAELAARREAAREIKEEILVEAEELASSTDWGATSRRYRELMARWKAAGPAPRAVDDALWKRFRAAQDTFFAARGDTFSKRDSEQRENLAAKEALLAEAEALVPITNWKAARQTLRSIQDRWEAAGHVPRDSMRAIESRLRRVEEAIRDAEQNEWQRTNPEARARAEATVAKLQESIAGLEADAAKAKEAGNARKAADAEEAVAARRLWLEQAERALDEFR